MIVYSVTSTSARVSCANPDCSNTVSVDRDEDGLPDPGKLCSNCEEDGYGQKGDEDDDEA